MKVGPLGKVGRKQRSTATDLNVNKQIQLLIKA